MGEGAVDDEGGAAANAFNGRGEAVDGDGWEEGLFDLASDRVFGPAAFSEFECEAACALRDEDLP